MSLKFALVTGASSGIGAEISRTLAEKEWSVVLLGRSNEKLEAVRASLMNSSQHRIASLDLSLPDSQEKLQAILTELEIPHLDLLVNNAGVFNRASFAETSLQEWERQFQTNLFGSIRATHACLPLLKKSQHASITNVASTLGVRPVAMTSAYSSSKAAMINWTQALALELAQDKIRVNSVSPGLIDTPIHDFYQTSDESLKKQLNAMQPMGFVGQPKHIAEAVWFLASEHSNWTTGTNLVVDGGIVLA